MVDSTMVAARSSRAGRLLPVAVSAVALAAGVGLQRSLLVGVLLMFALFVPLERLATLHPQRVLRPQFWSDLVHVAVDRPVGDLAAVAVALAVGLPLRALIPGAFRADVAAQAQWLQLIEVVPIAEVAGYWGHRAAHQVPFLWRFHRVHHSIEHMDFLAAARIHPLDSVAMRGSAIVPVVAMGFTPFSLGAAGIALTLVAIGVHANVRVRIPVLRWMVVTPEFHHWHHADEPDAIDTNFAGALPIVDVLFGTAHMPRSRIPARYGIGERLGSTWAEHMVSPLRG